jgi:hypothetical protein
LAKHGQSLTPITRPVEFDLENDDEYDVEMTRMKGRDPEE